MGNEHQPYLSIVACSRNDNHGDHLLERMQLFIDGIADQAERFRLDCELVLVEWNPPPDTPGLAEVLKYPDGGGYLTSRVIVVPPEVHYSLPHSEALPLFQMIAKNVGIRRARGEMVLATNIDILFSDSLFDQMAAQKLAKGVLYRADRADISVPFGEPLVLKELRTLPPIRVNRKNGTYDAKGVRRVPIYLNLWDLFTYQSRLHLRPNSPRQIKPVTPSPKAMSPIHSVIRPFIKAWRLQTISRYHANGCGDFTLLSANDWKILQGYCEWPIYSWNIDTHLLYKAHICGIREIDLPPGQVVLHMDHSQGSGWSPEGAGSLFQRMAERGVPVLSDDELVREIRKLRDKGCTQNGNWGYRDARFEESVFGRQPSRTG